METTKEISSSTFEYSPELGDTVKLSVDAGINTFEGDLFDRMPQLKREILNNACEYITNLHAYSTITPEDLNIGGWITKSSPGDYATVHAHGTSDISGCYYAITNGEDGNIFFDNPNLLVHSWNIITDGVEPKELVPKVGMVVMFPGWLRHGVTKNTSSHDRYSISFNIRLNNIPNRHKGVLV
jgi:uncharacterized protein (TIGR02466 family)